MAFVTFVVPTIWRLSLQGALDSLLAQTDRDWNAVVYGDGHWGDLYLSPRRNLGMMGEHRIDFWWQNPKGSAGLIRNDAIKMIRRYGDQTRWIAFLDDDDALEPEYVSHLRDHDEDDEPEVVVFRMFHPNMGVLPDVHRPVLAHGRVGISFAVREDVLPDDPFVREDLEHPGPDGNEDIQLLRRLQAEGADIMISPHVDYLVRPEGRRAT